MNHTSEDHEWAMKAKQGDKTYQDYYFFYDNWDENKPHCCIKLLSEKALKYNKKIVNDIIAKVSPEEMVLILRFYKEKTGNHVQNMVDKLPKTQKKFLTSFLFNVISPAEHYAYTIYQSLKGIGTNNQLLDRVLATRYDLDMPLVKQFYYDIYKVTAKEDIEDDTSEYYRELLIELLNYMDENDS